MQWRSHASHAHSCATKRVGQGSGVSRSTLPTRIFLIAFTTLQTITTEIVREEQEWEMADADTGDKVDVSNFYPDFCLRDRKTGFPYSLCFRHHPFVHPSHPLITSLTSHHQTASQILPLVHHRQHNRRNLFGPRSKRHTTIHRCFDGTRLEPDSHQWG